jgi:hypothetical protein
VQIADQTVLRDRETGVGHGDGCSYFHSGPYLSACRLTSE